MRWIPCVISIPMEGHITETLSTGASRTATQSRSGIEAVLGRRQSLSNDHFDGVGSQGHPSVHVSALPGRHPGQHPVSWILATGRTPNTDPHPNEITGTYVDSNGFQSIVAIVSASLFMRSRPGSRSISS